MNGSQGFAKPHPLGLGARFQGVSTMIWFTAAVTLFLFVYLLVALLRPERF